MSARVRCLSDVRRHEGGAVAMIFALLATVLFTMIAMAVDLARAYNAGSKLTTALDGAALAAAKALDGGATDAQVRQVAWDFFNASMGTLKIGGIAMSGFDADPDRVNSTVTVKIDAAMTTSFASVAGISTIEVGRSSTVSYKLLDVELAMALDITGSMNDNGKISHLRNAARDVIETMLTDASSETSARIALVPWSASVNAGSLASVVSGGASVDGCVVERTGSQAATDVIALGADVVNAIGAPAGHYECPLDPIVPLTGKSRINDLKDAVNSYNPMGWTAGHIGTAWGWYLISPSWASLLPSASAPAAYNPSKTIKSVLIMTDGMFNTSYINGTAQSDPAMTAESYQQFADLCTAMKAKGVVVYTVGFEIPAGGVEEQALSACASGSANFFLATNGQQLADAFKKVANQLTALRVTR